MSRAAKLTLAGTSLGAVAVVTLVHYQQNSEKAVRLPSITLQSQNSRSGALTWFVGLHEGQAMHAGVIRDIEQQRVKKERQADFEMQRALEEEYRKVQEVHDGNDRGNKAGGTG